MDEQTLVYWLNSLPVPSALLVSSIKDLDDGSTIIDIVKHFFPEAEDDGEPLDLERWVDHVHTDSIPHAVIVDCTASDAVAERYVDWLTEGLRRTHMARGRQA